MVFFHFLLIFCCSSCCIVYLTLLPIFIGSFVFLLLKFKIPQCILNPRHLSSLSLYVYIWQVTCHLYISKSINDNSDITLTHSYKNIFYLHFKNYKNFYIHFNSVFWQADFNFSEVYFIIFIWWSLCFLCAGVFLPISENQKLSMLWWTLYYP